MTRTSLSIKVKHAVGAGWRLNVFSLTWPGDLEKLVLSSASSEVMGGVGVHSAASSETSLQCATDNWGRWSQSLCSNKMNADADGL